MPAWSAPRLAPPESTKAVCGGRGPPTRWPRIARALVATAATAARARARCLARDLVAGRRQRIPEASEGVHALAAGVTGALVAGECVDRVAVVGDLRLAVGARRGSQHRGARAAAGRRLAAGAQRRPGSGACSGAGALGARVLLEEVE